MQRRDHDGDHDGNQVGAADRREREADEREIVADRRERADDVREAVLDRWERELMERAASMELLDHVEAVRLDTERSGRADAKRVRRAAADERRDAAIAREVDRSGRAAPAPAGETFIGLQDQARQTLERLGELVERDASLADTLSTVLDIATDVLDGAAAVTITLTVDGRLEPAASSAAWAAELDAVQLRHGVGAITDAITGRTVVVSSDLAADGRWQLADAVGPTGRRGMSSVPFVAGHAAPGVLTVYAEPGAVVSRESVLAATLLAAQVSVAVGLALERMSHRAQTEAWQRALESRDLIGQAKGILMAQHGVSAEAAFDLMRATSQEQNTKVRDVAAAVVTDRQLPEPPSPPDRS